MEHDLEHIARVAEEAARDAGTQFLVGRTTASSSVAAKRSVMDIVTDVDKAAERMVVERIRQSFPDDGIVGEEGAAHEGTTGRRWIIDPLDGTVNFVRGWRVSAVSIGVEIDGVFTVGVVHNPLQHETFVGVRGRGAWLNGERLPQRTGGVAWDSAIIGVDGGFEPWARAERSEILRRAVRYAGDGRTSGSTALALCYTAMGRFDAHSNTGSYLWDLAAGAVIAREVGLLVEGVDEGTAPSPEHILTALPEHMPQLRALVRTARGHH